MNAINRNTSNIDPVFIDQKIHDLLSARVNLAEEELSRFTRAYIRTSTNLTHAEQRNDRSLIKCLTAEVIVLRNEMEEARDTLGNLRQALQEVEERLKAAQ